MKQNGVVIDTTHGLFHLPHLKMEVKSAARETSAKPQSHPIGDTLTIPPMTVKLITAPVDHPSEWDTARIVNPQENFIETSNLLISYSMLAIIDRK